MTATATLRAFVAEVDADCPEWGRGFCLHVISYAHAREILAEFDAAGLTSCADAITGARVAQLIRQRDDLRDRVSMLERFNLGLQEALVHAQGPLDLDSTDPIPASPPTGTGKGNGAAQ